MHGYLRVDGKTSFERTRPVDSQVGRRPNHVGHVLITCLEHASLLPERSHEKHCHLELARLTLGGGQKNQRSQVYIFIKTEHVTFRTRWRARNGKINTAQN